MIRTFVFSALALFSITAHASSIVIPSNGSSAYFQENPSAPGSAVRSLGETFMVPSPTSQNVLTDFSFTFVSGTDTSFDYRALVFAWDSANSRATGPALYTSAAQTGAVGTKTFSGLNLDLTPGLTYIALLTTEGVMNNGYSNGLLADNSANVYAGGSAWMQSSATSNGSSGSGSWTAAAWSSISGHPDFQFTANFVEGGSAVPEPTSIGFLFSGVAAMLAFRRYRKAKG